MRTTPCMVLVKRSLAPLMEGGVIVLEVVRVASHSKIAHVGKSAHVFMMNVEARQLCCDCRVKHKLPWKSLSRRVGADWVGKSHKRTS